MSDMLYVERPCPDCGRPFYPWGPANGKYHMWGGGRCFGPGPSREVATDDDLRGRGYLRLDQMEREWRCQREDGSYLGPCSPDNPTPWPHRHSTCGWQYVLDAALTASKEDG